MYLGMVYEARVDVSVLDCGSHRNSLSNHMTSDPRFITYTPYTWIGWEIILLILSNIRDPRVGSNLFLKWFDTIRYNYIFHIRFNPSTSIIRMPIVDKLSEL